MVGSHTTNIFFLDDNHTMFGKNPLAFDYLRLDPKVTAWAHFLIEH